MKKSFDISKIDWTFTISALALILIGFVVIYSANNGKSILEGGGLFQKQIMWFVIGLVLVVTIQFIPSRFFFDFAYPIYAISIVLLIAAMFSVKIANNFY